MKRNTLERRERIKDLILCDGLWSLNKKKLARDFRVSYPTIYSDIRAILKKIPDDKIEEIGYELNLSFKEALSIARRLLRHTDDSLKLRAIDVLTKAIDRYTVFLESFGKKSIESQELEVSTKHFPPAKIEFVVSKGINGIREDVKSLAKHRGLSIFDTLCKIFPDEMDKSGIVKKWLKEKETEVF